LSSWNYFDGRGALVRSFGVNTSKGYEGTTDLEYDLMGRLLRTSNPYFAVNGATCAINLANLWTTREYDRLGRTKKVTTPDSNEARFTYSGKTSEVIDQAGKSRRQTTDGLGRLVELVEPNASGSLDDAANSPKTTYQYDALDNLVKIVQGAQQRFFKYNSLGQLTHERVPEQAATYSATDT
jgi:YD repeat-containing protein